MHPLWIVTTVTLVLIAIVVARFAIQLRAGVDELERLSNRSSTRVSTRMLIEHRSNTLKKAGRLGRSLRSSWGSEPN